MIRRSAAVFVLGLALFAALAPLGEAACPGEDCAGDDAFGGCSVDPCCSCCVHLRVDPVLSSSALPPALDRGTSWATRDRCLPGPDPREILHVPKPARSF